MAKEPLPPADPNIRVPRAVREGAARAEAAQRASNGIAEPPVLPPENSQVVPPPAGPSSPPVTPEVTPPAGAAPAPAAVAPAPPQEPPDPNAPVDWEHRYKTLAGRAEADRKRARESLEQMSNRMTQLEQQLVTTAPAPTTPTPRLNITPEELADYGEDFLSVVRRVAEHVVDGKIQPLASEVGRTRAQVGVQQARTMHQQMDALYPDWAKMNQHQRFIEWTMLPDAYSGAIRQKLMQEAWDAGDARRVNAFFQGFLAEEAALNPAGLVPPVAPAPAVPPLNGGGSPAATPPLTLAALAAPGGARSASAMPAEKRVYTTEDITRFYTEVAAGKWRGRDADRAAIDADISRAQHEGRIILNQRRYVAPAPPEGFTR